MFFHIFDFVCLFLFHFSQKGAMIANNMEISSSRVFVYIYSIYQKYNYIHYEIISTNNVNQIELSHEMKSIKSLLYISTYKFFATSTVAVIINENVYTC